MRDHDPPPQRSNSVAVGSLWSLKRDERFRLHQLKRHKISGVGIEARGLEIKFEAYLTYLNKCRASLKCPLAWSCFIRFKALACLIGPQSQTIAKPLASSAISTVRKSS